MKPLRIAAMIGLTVFGIYVAVTNALAVRNDRAQAADSIDSVSSWENRILPILKQVPEGVTRFGYVSDWDIPGAEFDGIDQDQEYVLTQYALAPRVVQPGLEHEWIIGNFVGSDFEGWLNEHLSSYEIKEIGYGIYLIHRTSP